MENKKNISLVLLFLIPLFGFADSKSVEITADDFKKFDTRNYVVHLFAVTEVEPGKSGKGVVWDFSDLADKLVVGPTLRVSNEAVDCEKTPYRQKFPQANECFVSYSQTDNEQSKHYYYKIRGEFYGRLSIADGKENIESCDISKEGSYPLALGKKYHTTLSCNDSDDGKKDFILIEEVDGEGTLILPDGEKFDDILRVREVIYKNKTISEIYIYISKDKGGILYLKDSSMMQIKKYIVDNK